MSDALFATYLIGLREGLEATLVVSILVAFLVRSGRRSRLPHVALGAGVAVLLSVGFGALLTYTRTSLLADYRDRELFEAVTSVAAVVFVTWMIFWMRSAARSMGGQLRAGLDHAIAVGPVAVVVFAFLAVVREGLETALLFFAAVQGATTNSGPLLAILGGVATSVLSASCSTRAPCGSTSPGSSPGPACCWCSSPPAFSSTACTTSRRPACCPA
jgi:high-affinity iron transporter